MFDFNLPPSGAATLNLNVNIKLDVTVRHVRSLQTPGPIHLKQIGEEMANQIRVQVDSAADADTVTREVTYSVDGGAPTVVTYPIGAPESFVVAEGAAVHVDVQDTDNAGNKSPVTSGDFTVSDTFPPAAPGAVSLTAIGEE